MQNTITAAQYTFTVTKANLPFSNNFTLNKAAVKQHYNKDEVHAVVTCTANSLEPGRMYYCIYSTKGKLKACNTLN